MPFIAKLCYVYVNQIIAAVMLFGIITAVFAPLIIESSLQIFSKSVSISDTMKNSREQTGQIIVSTNTQQKDGTIKVYLSNIGIENVRIHTVLVDGIESPFVLWNQDSVGIDTLATYELGVLKVTGTGNSVQLVTTTGKLFEFFIGM